MQSHTGQDIVYACAPLLHPNSHDYLQVKYYLNRSPTCSPNLDSASLSMVSGSVSPNTGGESDNRSLTMSLSLPSKYGLKIFCSAVSYSLRRSLPNALAHVNCVFNWRVFVNVEICSPTAIFSQFTELTGELSGQRHSIVDSVVP